MRIRLLTLSICLIWLSCTFLSAAEHGIRLSLSQESCLPGDVIELRAEMDRSDYAEFELMLPKIEALHLVSQQQGPITYSKGRFRQSALWVLQPKRSGDIVLKDCRAILKQGENETAYTLPTLELKVLSYPTIEDSLHPEPLPEFAEISEPSTFPVWLYVLFAAASVWILYLGIRLNSKKDAKALPPKAPLQELREALNTGTFPAELIERILAEEDLSPTLRVSLESALYNPKADPDAARRQIEEALPL